MLVNVQYLPISDQRQSCLIIFYNYILLKQKFIFIFKQIIELKSFFYFNSCASALVALAQGSFMNWLKLRE